MMLPRCHWQSGRKAKTESAVDICTSSMSPGTDVSMTFRMMTLAVTMAETDSINRPPTIASPAAMRPSVVFS
jgi:hypothetical protein